MRQYVRFSSQRWVCINHWKVAGVHCTAQRACSYNTKKRPRLPTVNAVYCFNSLSILDLPKSGLQVQTWKMTSTYQTSQGLLNSWQWVGILLCVGIKMQNSMQKHRLSSFFWTSTTALHHTLWLGQIMPKSNISHRCAHSSSTKGQRDLPELFF